MSVRVGSLGYDPKRILGRGSFGTVFMGFHLTELGQKKSVSVKRIQRSDVSADDYFIQLEVKLMQKAGDHPNILRYICTEMNDDFLYIATELCRGTLEDYIASGRYEGPKFKNEKEILLQVTKGLAHLHNLKIIYRSIKPNDILIFVPEGADWAVEPQIKLADFGISKMLKSDNDDFTNTSMTSPTGTRGWMAPEVYQVKRFDFKVDIWPLGCIFAYTLTGGKHPFGEDFMVRIDRIMKKEPMILLQKDLNIPDPEKGVAFELIQSMLIADPEMRPIAMEVLNSNFFITPKLTRVGRLSYDSKKVIGRGSFGTVFSGFIPTENNSEWAGDNKPVAVKRLQLSDVDESTGLTIQREVELMQKAIDHPNILSYICTETNEDFIFIVTDLCKGTLQDCVAGKYKEQQFLSEWQMLHQVSKGLAHLHSLNIVHRDITPKNILIFESHQGHSMKLADFGLSRLLKPNQSDFSNSNIDSPSGTLGWTAPELYGSARYTSKVDIFAIGCIFGYTLSGGKHPFGDGIYRKLRIQQREPMLFDNGDLKKPYSENNGVAFELIQSMLEIEPIFRPSAKDVVESTFFFVDPVRTLKLVDACASFRESITEEKIDRFESLVKDSHVDVNVVANEFFDRTPLHILCVDFGTEKLIDLVKLLIEKGANINARDRSGCTPFHLLCTNYKKSNLIDIMQLLIQNGADTNLKLPTGWTPLHVVCFYYKNENLIEIVRLLIQHGSDVNAKKVDGKTPLHLVCQYYKNSNLMDLVHLLIEKGADRNGAQSLLG